MATGAPGITPLEMKFLEAACVAQKATGVPIANLAKYLLTFSTTDRLEKVHPLQGGLFRRKYRLDRRSGLAPLAERVQTEEHQSPQGRRIRVVRAFVRTAHEEERFDRVNADLTSTSLSVNRLFAVMIPSLSLVMNLSTVAVIWFGGLRVDSGAMPIGNLTAFLQYIFQILFAVMMAVVMFVMVPRAAASAICRAPSVML